jgi:NDP-sugar pyrophosphorylase family protein
MYRRAIILAGGQGARLRPYTVTIPKPLVPVGEFPILEIIIRQLKFYGFTHLTLAVNHQAEIIKAYFGNGKKWGLVIDYSLEDTALSTMGPLTLIHDLPSKFLVMNGDILTDLDYAAFYEGHEKNGAIFTVSSHLREESIDYGVLKTNNGKLTGFQEKPKMMYEVSMGIYMASFDIMQFIPVNQKYGFDDLMQCLINAGKMVSVSQYSGYWLDIGRPDDYAKAVEEFAMMQSRFLG